MYKEESEETQQPELTNQPHRPHMVGRRIRRLLMEKKSRKNTDDNTAVRKSGHVIESLRQRRIRPESLRTRRGKVLPPESIPTKTAPGIRRRQQGLPDKMQRRVRHRVRATRRMRHPVAEMEIRYPPDRMERQQRRDNRRVVRWQLQSREEVQ